MNEQIQSLSEENDRLKDAWTASVLVVADLVVWVRELEKSRDKFEIPCVCCGGHIAHKPDCTLAKMLEATR